MCVACKVDTSCEHALKDCSAIEGEYCIVCHHHSAMPNLARRKPARLAPRKGPSHPGRHIALHDGDVIIVGRSNSPYVFKVRIG
jgi:hypothetical protein